MADKHCDKVVDKEAVQKSLDEQSERISFTTNTWKSDVWQQYVTVKVDGVAS